MISIIYSTHKDPQYNINFKQHLAKSIGINDFEILEFQNNNQYSLAEVYNKGIKQSKYDIVVCCHNDIKLESGWGNKLLKEFENNSEYGIIGKAGSCYFSKSGVYWEKLEQTMVGQVYHHPKGRKKFLSKYSPKLPFLVPVVTIDGLFISFNKTKVKHFFDESYGKFHYYDHGFCIPNYLDGVKIGVTSSFEITHESVGVPNLEFYQTKEKFLEKYGDILPLDLKPTEVFAEQFNREVIKKISKVAIIIPTKGNLNLLFNCIQSFITHCDLSNVEFFIGDTGSTEKEMIELKNFIKTNNNIVKINLIEYDYYNFAKVNNDIVKNHISDDFEFLLFCNNDIQLLNNIITNMLLVFKENHAVGTVGARLHYGDNTIQHCGIALFFDNDKKIQITHANIESYYNFIKDTTEVVGNTAALMMIRKSLFNKCGMFNETYFNCFEDAELNFKCITLGFKNYMAGKSVAYHFESQTRKYNPEKRTETMNDFQNNLLNYIYANIKKLSKYIKNVN